MRPKSIMLLVVALGCGLVAAIGIRQIVTKNAQASGDYETTPVFVAMKEIVYGDKIVIGGEDANVKLDRWPADKVPEGAIVNEDDIIDRQAGAHIPAGAAIFDSYLLGSGTMAGVSASIPNGFRAYTIKGTSDTVLGDMLRPHHRVDVMVYVEKKKLEAKGFPGIETQTMTILANIRVLAINDQTNRAQFDDAETSVTIKSVTLLVEEKQALRLAFAGELGKLRLVLRGESEGPASGNNDSGGGTIDEFGKRFEQIASKEKGRPADEISGPLPNRARQPTETVAMAPVRKKGFVIEVVFGSNSRFYEQDLDTKRMVLIEGNTNSQPTAGKKGSTAAPGQGNVNTAADADLPQGQVDLTDLVDEDQ